MANDIDMLRDINELHKHCRHKQAVCLEDLFSYVYGLGESRFKTKREFELAKKKYEKEFGFLDNYI